ncbi:MAG: response regulator transcription factor, partial [Acidobacteriota bacterium]|nr:response regulator transcription factor [Acidobacteriota bacterium]
MFREGLSRLLEAEPDFRIAGNCASVSEALAALESEPADVVLLDYDLGQEQGSEFIRLAKLRRFNLRVLMVTAGMSDTDTLRALENGASGIFLKHSPPAQLVAAIHKVFNGETWLDSGAVRSLIAGASERSEEQRTSQPLNQRERAVLKALFEGLTNKEIATKLNITETAVKWAIQQLFDKTGVRTRSQLVRIALEKRLQDGPAA